ncbi:dynein beta chain, ciliary-like [Xylocopa sonorina]|uniref:dynein beta chain, ciliary-like n=1 Tax=Xylocopa sonorina TaxID=1818115 RepID=UPI00403A926E
MADKKEDEKKEEDQRLEYIFNYLTYTRKLKIDRWTKMLSNVEFKEMITRFFGVPSEMILVLQLTPAGLLVPYLEITQSKRKQTYFMKRRPQTVTEDNYKDLLIPGDMAPNPIEELAVLVEDAYVPILSNPKNHVGWPEIVRKDVKKQVYNLRSLIWQVKGKITGQTLLPMPMGIEEIINQQFNNSKIDASKQLQLKSNIEEIIIKWATQINEILNEEVRKFSKNGKQQPISELDYWNMRLKNMESLYYQLKDPMILQIDIFLEKMESPYSAYFKNLVKNVAAALLETRNINLYLWPLNSYFQEIESTEFKDILTKLKVLLHCVCLMWSNSKYYSMERIIILLQEISNLLISQAVKYINPATLFSEDIEENKVKIAEVIPCLNNYQEMFRSFKEKIENYFKSQEPALWTFHEKLVLERIYMFEKRLKEIEALFDIVQDYLKLERIEMAGLKAKSLLSMINSIYEEFIRLYQQFADAPYEVLTPEEVQFTEDLNEFSIMIEQFDRRLASIFDQAFAECHNLFAYFKFIWIISFISNRPIIMSQLWHNYEEVIERADRSFSNAKALFDENFMAEGDRPFLSLDTYLPPVASSLCLLIKLRERTRYPVQCMKLIDHPLITAKMENELKNKYEELEMIIDEKENEIYLAWKEKLPEILETHLTKTLLIVKENKLLEMNFVSELKTALREIRYMIIMKKSDLLPEAIEFYNRSQFFFNSTYNLNLIVNWYNRIRSESAPVEFQLVEEEVENIDNLINYGQENYNWNSEGITEYIDNLSSITWKLHARVFRAQENLKNILDRMYAWAMMPIIYRKDAKDDNLIALTDKDDRFSERFAEIEATAEQLKQILKENYKLFFDLLPDYAYERDDADLIDSEGKEEAEPEGTLHEEGTELTEYARKSIQSQISTSNQTKEELKK